MPNTRPKLVGLNHIALEVGSVEQALAFYGAIFTFTLRGREEGMALAFYGAIFTFTLRGREEGMAFIDLGDQFLALMEGPVRQPEGHRHFGLVVEDRAAVQTLAEAAGAVLLDRNSFLDPWGNRVEVVAYGDVQFTKADAVQRGMGLDLDKSPDAREQLRRKGMTPDEP